MNMHSSNKLDRSSEVKRRVGNKENINQSTIVSKGNYHKKQKKRSSYKEGQSATGGKTGGKDKMEYLKSKMKEHFRFFDNHSPELKKVKKGNSHSPPKKDSASKSHHKHNK